MPCTGSTTLIILHLSNSKDAHRSSSAVASHSPPQLLLFLLCRCCADCQQGACWLLALHVSVVLAGGSSCSGRSLASCGPSSPVPASQRASWLQSRWYQLAVHPATLPCSIQKDGKPLQCFLVFLSRRGGFSILFLNRRVHELTSILVETEGIHHVADDPSEATEQSKNRLEEPAKIAHGIRTRQSNASCQTTNFADRCAAIKNGYT